MTTETFIQSLHTLIDVNNDRIEAYKTASKESDEADLIILFAQFQHTSEACKAELEKELWRLGGKPAVPAHTRSAIHRAWLDIKAVLSSKERIVLLNTCNAGDALATEAYQEILENSNKAISMEQQTMLYAQYELIKGEYDEVRILRDMLVEQD